MLFPADCGWHRIKIKALWDGRRAISDGRTRARDERSGQASQRTVADI
jgi:hypothetical protein